MTKEDLFKLHQEMTKRSFDILKAKNHDYSKGHPLGNFMVAEALQACSAVNGIVVRMSDKLSRVVSITEKGAQVADESVTDTLIDLINYAVLLQATIDYKKQVVNPGLECPDL